MPLQQIYRLSIPAHVYVSFEVDSEEDAQIKGATLARHFYENPGYLKLDVDDVARSLGLISNRSHATADAVVYFNVADGAREYTLNELAATVGIEDVEHLGEVEAPVLV